MPESFENLYQKALAAAAKIIPSGGMHTYEATEHWPRFYLITHRDGERGYHMATEEFKNGNLKGFFVRVIPGKRKPTKAVSYSILKPRRGEIGWTLIPPTDVPPEVIERLREKME